jgi:hypothetical protein
MFKPSDALSNLKDKKAKIKHITITDETSKVIKKVSDNSNMNFYSYTKYSQ